MANNEIKTRIKQRYDTLANWESKNPILLEGEVARVRMEDNTVRNKTGDGTSTFNSLSWDDKNLYNGNTAMPKIASENSLLEVSILLNDTQFFTHPELGPYDTLTNNSYSALGSSLELTATDIISTNTILATFTVSTTDEYKNSAIFNGMIIYPTIADYTNDTGIKYNYYTSTLPTTYYGTIYKIKFIGDGYVSVNFSKLKVCSSMSNGFISDSDITALHIHLNDRSNPHNITPEKIRATPLSHMFNYGNPHQVTAAQVGAATAEHTHNVAEINSIDFTNLKNTSTGKPSTTNARFSLSTDSPYQGWYKLSDAKNLMLAKPLIPVIDDNYVDIEIAAINCDGYVTCNSKETEFNIGQTINFKYSGRNASDFLLRLNANSNNNTIYIKFNICKDGFMSAEDKLNLSNLQTQVSALTSTITELENRISQLETQLTGVEAQLAQI